MMKSFFLLYLLALFTLNINAFLHFNKPKGPTSDQHLNLANVKIYSNLAEIIQPLGRLPIEFSQDDWNDIRTDSVTLVGTNVNITQQTITEKKTSLNNVQVHVRSPTSSNTETKFIRATIIDEKRYLIKMINKDVSKDPVFLTVPSDHIIFDNEPPQTKYYVNFTYVTSDAVYLSYLRSNLNWKTRYQLNLFEDSKSPVLIAMADIRNDGYSKVDIEYAELLGGDINLQMYQHQAVPQMAYYAPLTASARGSPGMSADSAPIKQGEELAGLYVFTISQPFSIEAKTNYLLPMFRPRVTVERYSSFAQYFYGSPGYTTSKSQRSYRLVSDRFLTHGNCITRESDRLAGETSLPDIAAKDKHEFSLGQDSDVVLKENVTLISKRVYNETIRLGSKEMHERTDSVYNVNVAFKNFKKNRPVKVEYVQHIVGHSLKLQNPASIFTLEGSKIKGALTLAADEEKTLSYKFEVIN